jgi:predicted double-glycine peptidase
LPVLAAFALAALLFAGFYDIHEHPEDEVNISAGAQSTGMTTLRNRVRPLSEFEHDRLEKQMYDFSCGSAALATLLNHYTGEDFDEMQVINGLLKYGDAKKIIERRAFSLLDMKNFVNMLGYKGIGYNAEIEDMQTLDMPCIIPLELYGYRHFVVFKDIYENHVFIADPSKGNISFTISEFKKMWYQNIAFVVYPKGGKENTGLHALQLGEDDLRIIDEKMRRNIIFNDYGQFSIPAEKRMLETVGDAQFYKSK